MARVICFIKCFFTIFFTLIVMLRGSVEAKTSSPEIFRFAIQATPETFDPQKATHTINSYVQSLLHGTLMRYEDGRLLPAGAHDCRQLTPKKYRCRLRKDWLWSDGQPILSAQFVLAWQALALSPRKGNFSTIEKVVAAKPDEIIFSLNSPDPDFLYRLIDPAFSPRRQDIESNGTITSGQYYYVTGKSSARLRFKPNLDYLTDTKAQPPALRADVEVLVVDSEITTIRLFQKGEINFVQRIATESVPSLKNHPGFRRVAFLRMDYVGFSPIYAAHDALRKLMVSSLFDSFEPFKNIFFSLGPPGCFGLPNAITGEPLCFEHKNTSSDKGTSKNKAKPLRPTHQPDIAHTLAYATQGGADIERGMTLFQNAWKKAGINVELQPLEWGVLNQQIRSDNPPPLFRRGVILDRPTCLAAAEIFTSNNPDNLIRLADKKYDDLVQALEKRPSVAACKNALKRLLETHRVIPLGLIHYAQVSDNKFNHIIVNELGQLDLSRLALRPIK